MKSLGNRRVYEKNNEKKSWGSGKVCKECAVCVQFSLATATGIYRKDTLIENIR